MLCLIAVCCIFLMIQPKLFPVEEYTPENKTQSETQKKQTPDIKSSTEEEPEENVPYECPQKLTEANANNPDAYAWIEIPGMEVDFPVLQSPTNDSFYLRRDINGKYLISGSIMTEHTYNTTTFEDPVTVIYGHCMESGAMFGRLQDYYSSEEGMETYKTIEIYLPDKKLEYEVFAAVPYDTRHILYNYDFDDPRIFRAFFKSIESIRTFNSMVKNDEIPVYGEKVLILSTCLKGNSNARYLVMAKQK